MDLFHVDAFTDRPFAGNPAAVCLLDEARDDAWQQQLAAEMNLSETAFVRRHGDMFALRWFTPVVEVDLCGHATLASAHVLWQQGHVDHDQAIRFMTRSGVLTVTRRGEWIDMDFPTDPPQPCAAVPALEAALGVKAAETMRGRFDYLVTVADQNTLRRLAPDMQALARIETRGVMVTCAGSDADFVSRFFAPAAGIAEDPVTGSAHCCLGPYWQARTGKSALRAYQASPRGGWVHVQCRGERVLLAGQAVTVASGRVRV